MAFEADRDTLLDMDERGTSGAYRLQEQEQSGISQDAIALWPELDGDQEDVSQRYQEVQPDYEDERFRS